MADLTGPVTACATCGDSRLPVVLDLGDQPLAERDDGKTYPLAVAQCAGCGLAQLTYAVPRARVFRPDHPYATGNTRALRAHFDGLAATVAPQLRDGDLLADIGANDGTLLAAVARHAPRARLLGVEPTGQAAKITARGIPAEQVFFGYAAARAIRQEYGPARVVTACNVLAHAGDQHDFMTGVTELLAPDGRFITENHHWASVVNGLQADTVYHEHLRYYTPATLGRLLELHGFFTAAAEAIPVHGGSFRVTAVRSQPGLQVRADAARDRLRAVMKQAAAAGPVWGIGATTRATPLVHWAGIADLIGTIAEVPGSARIGTLLPGTFIPVVDEAELIAAQPPHALLLAWHIAGDIVPKLRAAGYQGRFITPLPEAGLTGD
jgi:hypothetical protein